MGFTKEMWIAAEIERLSQKIIKMQEKLDELTIERDQIKAEIESEEK